MVSLLLGKQVQLQVSGDRMQLQPVFQSAQYIQSRPADTSGRSEYCHLSQTVGRHRFAGEE
jgi:hypothetical protein